MGGGGGSTGTVRYAEYLEGKHGGLIDNGYVSLIADDDLALILHDLFNADGPQAPKGNPYLTQSAYSPDLALSAMFSAINVYADVVDELVDDTKIDDEVYSFDLSLSNRLLNITLPLYSVPTRDICAVQESAFTLGATELLIDKGRELTYYKARAKFDWKRLYIQHLQVVTTMSIDTHKLQIIAKHDEEGRDSELDRLRAYWRLDTLLKGGQFMGILGGGTMVPDKESKTQSAVGMGLAGAAAGAYFGPWGALAGGIIGVGASFL